MTVRAGRPRVLRVYAATYRLSRSAATRPASCPHASAGPVTAGPLGVWSGSTGGCVVHPARATRHPVTAAIYILIVFLVSIAGKTLADSLRKRYGVAAA